jgi:hypothetical protein
MLITLLSFLAPPCTFSIALQNLFVVTVNLEGFELPAFMEINGEPLLIGLPLCSAPQIESWIIASQDRQRQTSSFVV